MKFEQRYIIIDGKELPFPQAFFDEPEPKDKEKRKEDSENGTDITR